MGSGEGPGFKFFKLFKSRPELNNLNIGEGGPGAGGRSGEGPGGRLGEGPKGRAEDLNYLIPGPHPPQKPEPGLFGSWLVYIIGI